MIPRFCLISQPWIPCILCDGTQREFGLLEVLARASDIREISDPSPPVTVCIHRLLLALLHRNFGPRNTDEWVGLWRAGKWDTRRLEAYFAEWETRFDLFDKERPFYQSPGMPDKMRKSVALLRMQAASGNNATLFDHSLDRAPAPATPAEAARLVLAQQGFNLGGLTGTEQGRASSTAAPIAASASVLLNGSSLFEGLVLSLLPATVYEDDFPGVGADVPAWERDTPCRTEIRAPAGYLDYLTWQSRRIWCIPEEDGAGGVHVITAILSTGCEFPRDYTPVDPFIAYQRRERPAKGQEPWGALRFSETRAIWRDSLALYRSIPDRAVRPRVLDFLANLTRRGDLSQRTACDLSLLGLGSNQAKILLWRHERQPLPLRYLVDEDLVKSLGTCLQDAEEGHDALERALRKLAGLTLSPDDEKKADKDLVRRLADSYDARRRYWALLEPEFHRLVVELAELDDREEREDEWTSLVCTTAEQCFDATGRGLKLDARSLRAMTAARGLLAYELRQLMQRTSQEVNHAQAD
ncbi:MAG: type I-E CRISPR-associated protein Cse1/CasA [Armatimonadetes bacterium]|nr:type I-E CRISPR-associated protein Cse1/CasA [Armatimonadota bacterium]